MVLIVDDCGTLALELTTVGVYDEEGLAEYVLERVSALKAVDIVELVTLLAAVSAATLEAWADETGRPVEELIQAAGLHYARQKEDG